MPDITPPYDFPPPPPSPGQKAQQLANMIIAAMLWIGGPEFPHDALASVIAAIIAWHEARK